jgi:hypothetical protein
MTGEEEEEEKGIRMKAGEVDGFVDEGMEDTVCAGRQ